MIATLLPLLAVAAPAHATPPGWALGGLAAGARDQHSATLLKDGSVLVVGGFTGDDNSVTNVAERYFPATNSWQPAGTLDHGRAAATTVLLDNAKVLVAGGIDQTLVPLGSAEL